MKELKYLVIREFWYVSWYKTNKENMTKEEYLNEVNNILKVIVERYVDFTETEQNELCQEVISEFEFEQFF